ncbi:MAG: hypothetical protein WC675_03160 [Patescibacteria group bacterium]|jgi:hypothetical protein
MAVLTQTKTRVSSKVVFATVAVVAIGAVVAVGYGMISGGLAGVTLVPVSCSETDSGQNYFKVGTTTVIYNTGYVRVERDVCNGAGTLRPGTLREWYCGKLGDPAGLLRSVNYYKCLSGCQNGACITTTTPTSTPPLH